MEERNHRREFIVRVEFTLLEFGLELPTSAPALSRDPLQVKYRVTIDPRQPVAEASSLEHDRRPNRAP
jgi:hypothetical protein